MDSRLRQLVRDRAQDSCEYCRLNQRDAVFAQFHVEHVIARQHGGGDDEANLALACHHCNLHKGPNVAGFDPLSGALTPLFNPRTQAWEEHFSFVGDEIVGLTAIGRTTVYVLNMNAPLRRILRAELHGTGR